LCGLGGAFCFILNTKNKTDLSIKQTEPDWRGSLSPFRMNVDIKSGGVIKTSNVYELDSYQWFPDGVVRKIQDDYYDNYSKSEGVGDTDGGLFTGFSLSDVSSMKNISNLKNKTLDYAKSQFDGVKKSVTGTVDGILNRNNQSKTEDDITTNTLNNVIPMDIINNIPVVKVYEFQPNTALSELVGAFKASKEKTDSFFKDGGDIKQLLTNIGSMFTKDGMDSMLKELIPDVDSGKLSSPHGQVIDIPNFFYKNLIGGFYSGLYKFPFFEKTEYLHGMGDQGWESKSLKQRLLPGPLAGIADKVSSVIGAFDIASRPNWNMNGAGPVSDKVEFSITLFNSSSEATVKNIKMIHSLVGGNMWLQKGLIQISPCLYDVEVVGRFRYWFCTADIKVDFIGQNRTPSEKVISDLTASLDMLIRMRLNSFQMLINYQLPLHR
jgi:hypothetical protein